MNDSNEFEKLFKEIYPSMLELKKENVSNFSASYLDLFISIVNRRFDKRDAFNNFDIVRFPFRCSNIIICFTQPLAQKLYASVAQPKLWRILNLP